MCPRLVGCLIYGVILVWKHNLCHLLTVFGVHRPGLTCTCHGTRRTTLAFRTFASPLTWYGSRTFSSTTGELKPSLPVDSCFLILLKFHFVLTFPNLTASIFKYLQKICRSMHSTKFVYIFVYSTIFICFIPFITKSVSNTFWINFELKSH